MRILISRYEPRLELMLRYSGSVITYRPSVYALSFFHIMSPVGKSRKLSSSPKPIVVKAERISASPPLRSISPEEKLSVPTDPRDIDYRAHPELYKILRGEMNVFKTQPYSNELKVLWRFKDEATARRSSAELYSKFEEFR